MQIEGVTLFTPANVYFDGEVVSHTFKTSDGQRHTVGIIFPGSYVFKTSCREKMQITAGLAEVSAIGVRGGNFGVGDEFEIPPDTKFRLSCDGPVEYICTYFE